MSLLRRLLFFAVSFGVSVVGLHALDLGPMKWTPRSNWINVKSDATVTGGPNAVGDGLADDTMALQGVLTWVQSHGGNRTIYFPPGTYKITGTLKIHDVSGVSLLGCGSRTILSYAGPTGGAMFLPSATHHMIYMGLTWEGNNLASCAYEHASQATYETVIHHESESFRNFTAVATYSFLDSKGNTITSPIPPTAAILTGFPTTSGGGLTGETMVYNCAFHHCTMGIVQAWDVGNNFMWHVDGCQFEDCDYGINFFMSGCNDVDSCHFERSRKCDVMGGHSMHVRHCTSHGSARFYANEANCPLSPDILEDCRIDAWTDVTGAVHFDIPGPNVIFDCNFTHPPAHAGPPINLKPLTNLPPQLLMSNNREGNMMDAALLNKIASHVVVIPPGNRGGVLTSAQQTFLRATVPGEGTPIIDVTHAPYSVTSALADCTPPIQAAIAAARKANNGSIVYIPGGIYKVGSTLQMGGGHYTVEGEGFATMLCYTGPAGGALFSVRDPQGVTIRRLRLAVPPGQNVAGIHETAAGPCQVIFDELTSNSYNPGNPGASGGAEHEPGILLDRLPAGAKVYLPHVDTPITVQSCGAARVFSKFLQIGMITVNGAVPQTGFLGAQVLEGGQQLGSGHNIVVNDNCNLTIGDYYSEQCGNDLSIARGNGTGEGHVAIQGFLSASGNNNGSGAATTSINVDDYRGRLLYGSTEFGNYNGSLPVQITQSGANPIDMVLAAVTFTHGAPAIRTESGARVVQTLNVEDAPYPGVSVPDVPSPLTERAKQAIARGLDDMRELEAVDLNFEFGSDAPASSTPKVEYTVP